MFLYDLYVYLVYTRHRAICMKADTSLFYSRAIVLCILMSFFFQKVNRGKIWKTPQAYVLDGIHIYFNKPRVFDGNITIYK